VRGTHGAVAVDLPRTTTASAAGLAPRQHPAAAPRRSKRSGGRSRRTIRLAILAGLLLLSGIWLARNNGLSGLFSQANSAATELATTNTMAADALNLLGFGRIRAVAGLPPICDIHHPSFLYGFAALKLQIGAVMGEPLECEQAIHPTGDTRQLTSTGLAYYRNGVNIPSFVDGLDHWALTERGLVHWIGDVVDPPGTALPSGSR
jgi:hypothetical protein